MPGKFHIVLSALLQPRLLAFALSATLAGHPCQNKMYYTVLNTYYWLRIAVDIAEVVCSCHSCAKNIVKLQKNLNRLKLFPATRPHESVATNILGPSSRIKSRKRFLLVITDRFTKLTQVAALAKIAVRFLAVAFLEIRVIKYGIPIPLLSNNGPQLAGKVSSRYAVC